MTGRPVAARSETKPRLRTANHSHGTTTAAAAHTHRRSTRRIGGASSRSGGPRPSRPAAWRLALQVSQVAWRYFLMASGTKAATSTAVQASARGTEPGVPTIRWRQASTTTVTGWFRAKGCSQPGIELTCTNADEANVRGNSNGKAMAWAVSALRALMPTTAKAHDRA